MSRYSIYPRDDGRDAEDVPEDELEIRWIDLGLDPSMRTFFAHVWEVGDDEDDGPFQSYGRRQGEVPTVERLERLVAPWADNPANLWPQLLEDQRLDR